ncbi:MAG: hypothetical protein HY986_09685 [Candidatus Melainabacteria bacterium]|nr:hypothetical protein [Candidatus Melainabacteria bacterium]
MKTIVVAGVNWQVIEGIYYAKIGINQLRIDITKGVGYVAGICLLTAEKGWVGVGNSHGKSEDEAFEAAMELVEYLYAVPNTSYNPWRQKSITGLPENVFYARLDGNRTLRIETDAFHYPSYCAVLSILGEEKWNVLRVISYRGQDERCDEKECESRRNQAFEEMVEHAGMLYPGRLSQVGFFGV